jgi:hypothetical protein
MAAWFVVRMAGENKLLARISKTKFAVIGNADSQVLTGQAFRDAV